MKVFKKSLAMLLALLMALGGMAVAAAAVETITVRFFADINGNGSFESGEITTKVVATTGTIAAPGGVERAGYTLKGWTENYTLGTNYAGTYYAANESLGTLAVDTDFYAVFQANKYIVTFDGNGGKVSTETKEVAYDADILLDDVAMPTKTLNTFDKWSRSKTEYVAPGKMDSTAGVTLYALWKDSAAGDNTIYSFDPTTGTLTFTGEGNIDKQADWAANVAAIKKIVIDGDDEITVNEKAFAGLTALEQVILNSEVAFGEYAFDGCSNLSKINTVEDGAVTAIGAYCFNDCVSFKGLNGNGFDLSDYSAYKIAAMEGVFCGCSALKKVILPTTVTAIPDAMFCGCTTLGILNPTAAVNVSFPASVTAIGVSAFEGCSALENVRFGEGILTIAERAFADCTALKAINTYNAALGTGAFSGCKALAKFECTALQAVPDECFKDCSALTAFDFTKVTGTPETRIGTSAFENCTALASVTFNSNVNSDILINKYAFLGCTALSSVSVPEGSVAAVGEMGLGYASKGVKAVFGSNNMTIVCSSSNNKQVSGYTGIYDYAAGFNRVTHAQQSVDTVMPLIKKIASFFGSLLPSLGKLFTTFLDFIKKIIPSAES